MTPPWVDTIGTAESEKTELANPKPAWRKAHVCLYELSSGRTFDGIVGLLSGKLESFAHVPGAQARINTEHFLEGGNIATADPQVQGALRKRGITGFDRGVVETWAAGNFGIASEECRRIAYGHCWLPSEDGENPNAMPIGNQPRLVFSRSGPP